MSWQPQATVTINGTNFTGQTLEGLGITYGRATVNEQARAGYARAQLIDVTATGINVSILDTISIKVKNSSGTDLTIFTGRVSDLDVSLDSENVAIYSITATSALAQVVNKTAGLTGYSSQLEGERIAAILDVTLNSVTWENYINTVTWANAPGTWEDVTGQIGTIDTGDFTLEAYTAAAANAYDLITQAANSGLGQIYETPAGEIGYSRAAARQLRAQNDGYLDLEADITLLDGITSTQTGAEVINTATIKYALGEETYESLASIRTYGVMASDTDTQLSNAIDAALIAERTVKLYQYPRTNLTSFTVQLALSQVTDTDRDALIAVNMGLPIRVYGLPSAVYSSIFSGFVEGWTWSINEYTAKLQLNVSDFMLSVVATRWQDVNPAELWNTLSPTMTWETAEQVA